MNLSNPATEATHVFAEAYLNRQSPTGSTTDQILYDEIMAPVFSGDHWTTSPPEEILEGWSDSSGSITESSSMTDSDDERIWTPSTSKSSKRIDGEAANSQREEEEERLRDARAILEGLGERAYWVQPGVEVPSLKEGVYGWKEMSTGELV